MPFRAVFSAERSKVHCILALGIKSSNFQSLLLAVKVERVLVSSTLQNLHYILGRKRVQELHQNVGIQSRKHRVYAELEVF